MKFGKQIAYAMKKDIGYFFIPGTRVKLRGTASTKYSKKGGADGIGYDIADKYLQEEAKAIILLDINEVQGTTAANTLNSKHDEGKAVYIKCDVTIDLEDVSNSIFQTFKNIDVLVNCAGVGIPEKPKKIIDVNTTAVIEWSLKFYEYMNKNKTEGTIINISSVFGFRNYSIGSVYQASKYAVFGFSKSLGHEVNFSTSGVRVIVICPGFTETKLTAVLTDDSGRKSLSEELLAFFDEQPWQKVDAVGRAAVEVFKNAKSGTAWMIEGGGPVVEVP